MQLLKRTRIIIAFIALISINIAAFSYIAILSTNYGINPFDIKPQKTSLQFTLHYPPSVYNEVLPIWFRVNFSLIADEQITENTEINYEFVSGEVFTENVQNITEIIIGFYNTNSRDLLIYLRGEGNKTSPNLAVSGFSLDVQERKLVLQWYLPFAFPVAGDYSPTIVVIFTDATFAKYTYDDIKVHVISASELQTQELDRINAFLAVALLIFSDFELIKLLTDWIKNAPTEYSIQKEKPEQSMGYDL